MDVRECMMKLRKSDLIRMADDLIVSAEINPKDRKSKIVSDLSQVLCTENVQDWLHDDKVLS